MGAGAAPGGGIIPVPAMAAGMALAPANPMAPAAAWAPIRVRRLEAASAGQGNPMPAVDRVVPANKGFVDAARRHLRPA